jgi:hypothetical protein
MAVVPLLVAVPPSAENVRLAADAPEEFVTVRSEPRPSNMGVSPSLRSNELP